MNNALNRLLQEDFTLWDEITQRLERRNRDLKVPAVEKVALHLFNQQVEETYTEALYHFGRARRNRDAIQRFIKNVLDNYYKGPNEVARKAAGIQRAQAYPTPEDYPQEAINLFDLEDQLMGYFYSLEATIKSLQAKADAKITNNSLLNLEKQTSSY